MYALGRRLSMRVPRPGVVAAGCVVLTFAAGAAPAPPPAGGGDRGFAFDLVETAEEVTIRYRWSGETLEVRVPGSAARLRLDRVGRDPIDPIGVSVGGRQIRLGPEATLWVGWRAARRRIETRAAPAPRPNELLERTDFARAAAEAGKLLRSSSVDQTALTRLLAGTEAAACGGLGWHLLAEALATATRALADTPETPSGERLEALARESSRARVVRARRTCSSGPS